MAQSLAQAGLELRLSQVPADQAERSFWFLEMCFTFLGIVTSPAHTHCPDFHPLLLRRRESVILAFLLCLAWQDAVNEVLPAYATVRMSLGFICRGRICNSLGVVELTVGSLVNKNACHQPL